VVQTELCSAQVFVWGAHVAAWTPALSRGGTGERGPGEQPALFLSPRSAFGGGKAIRGGIPVCFPWFAARRDDPRPGGRPSLSHGFARTRRFHVEDVVVQDNGRVELVFLLVSDDDTLALWPHAFEARLTVSLGESLMVSFAVTNVDDAPFEYEAALHTYLEVGDVAAVRLTGLEGTTFIDKMADNAESSSGASPLVLQGPTDRIFTGTRAAVVIDDPVLRRRIHVDKQGSHTTVVWNPWLVGAATMADLGGDAWRHFVCVEAANTWPQPVFLPPGATHTLTQRLRVVPARSLDG
jgi:glucose-6-phosphate 1-epimerase